MMPNCVFCCSLVERLRGNAYITTSDLIRQNLKMDDGMRKRPDNTNKKADKNKKLGIELLFFDDFFIYENMASRRPP